MWTTLKKKTTRGIVQNNVFRKLAAQLDEDIVTKILQPGRIIDNWHWVPVDLYYAAGQKKDYLLRRKICIT